MTQPRQIRSVPCHGVPQENQETSPELASGRKRPPLSSSRKDIPSSLLHSLEREQTLPSLVRGRALGLPGLHRPFRPPHPVPWSCPNRALAMLLFFGCRYGWMGRVLMPDPEKKPVPERDRQLHLGSGLW